MRLIDADEFFKDFVDLEPYEHISHEYDIDAVEVVRCKDCRWYISDWLKRDGTEDNRYAPNICNLHGRPHSETYFCADGEVKDETY